MNAIAEYFEKMGARAKVRRGSRLQLNVLNDKDGEYFDIQTADAELAVLNIDKADRHLLIQTREEGGGGGNLKKGGKSFNTQKFLCGHDERHWFVATVDNGAGTVAKAKLSLKPAAVREEESRKGVNRSKRGRRHNKASHRQGEWFFIPQPDFRPPEDAIILKGEPFTRPGGGKPHIAEMSYRHGGDNVWVSSLYPSGIEYDAYMELPESTRKKYNWRNMRRNAAMYVKGKISHPDHKTLELGEWCIVVMNTEKRSANVAFLD